MSEPQVSVVIVTYNSEAVISDCVRPLSGQDGIELIVLDNASTDRTLTVLAEEAPDAVVIRSEENVGFARGVNRAARDARGRAILLLNPDARISPRDVLALAAIFDESPEAGIVAPTLIQPAGRLRIREGGKRPNVVSVFNHFSGLSRLSHRHHRFEGLYLLHTHDFATRELDWVSGACMMVRKQTWDELGGLTERWFMYAEDLEFCLRTRQHGMRIIMSAEQSGTHVVGGSTGPTASTRPNPAWVINLYDLYKWKMARNRVQSVAWKASVAAGLLSRSAAFYVKSLGAPERSVLWRSESHKFLWYTRSLLAQSSRIDEAAT
ncbi:glycosyl transferase [Rhodococcus sp. ACS1]|uniref:glycosyltransferase family 2 protein n=1 Tax=Rhodococcus TaxID=1827 RepID=UPI000BB0DE91|nr:MULTISPECIES: glycosyltransferase family 2 protein [Rhodococcus]PBC51120.1 glycosyl transferase [Rhodococcus sp. ACS1]QSE83029.1 glycosyltransferase family 2 protein [Rhodococcus koreensis]